MSTQRTLTAKELIQYIGQQVQIDAAEHPKHGEIGVLSYVRDKIEGNPLTPTVGVCFEGELFARTMPLASIRLILRSVFSLTAYEAKQCFRVGFAYWDQRETVSLNRNETQVEIVSGPIRLIITTTGDIASERWIDGSAGPARVNVVALLNYLDSLRIDTHGYIEQGLALSED